jgi:hypothetical protein
MKKLFLLFISFMLSGISFGQLTGTKTIPGNYATIASAIADLNTQGVGAGGVTFNIAAGYAETFASSTTGYITSNTGTSANQIIFQKSGSGANPKITAPTGTGTMDAIICFSGVSFITFDGIDIQEKAANTTATTQMEWGYAILKASATQGSQNITIKNCTVSLHKTYAATYGIYSNNHTTAAMMQLIITTTSGQNSNNRFYGNTITNCNNGICLYGYGDPTAPYTYYDQGNDIGSVKGNTMNNFAGNIASSYCIYAKFQNGITIAKSLINGGTGTSGNIYGIYGDTAVNADVNIYNNTVTLASFPSTTTGMYGIFNAALGNSGTTNTINVHDNTVQNCVFQSYTFNLFYGCCSEATGHTVNFYGNTVTGNTIGPTYGTYLTSVSQGAGGSSYIYNNTITNNHRDVYTNSVLNSYTTCINILGSGSVTVHDNIISGISATTGSTFAGIMHGIFGWNSTSSQTIYNNTIHDIVLVSGYSSVNSNDGINVNSSDAACTISITGNSIYNLNTTLTGTGMVFASGITGNYITTCANNTVHDINVTSSSTQGSIVEGIMVGVATTISHTLNNKVYNLTASGPLDRITGLDFLATTVYCYNNFVYSIKAPSSSVINAIYGIILNNSGPNNYLCNNTVYLDAISSSTGTFGTYGIYGGSTYTNLEMRNNIIVNVSSAPASSSYRTVAFQRGSTTLTPYAASSNNNDFYAGTPGPNNLIYYDGTNADQTLAAFKARVYPRDSASVTENPPFVNVATLPYDVHIKTNVATLIESHGTVVSVPSIITDIDGDPRYPNPGYPDNPSTPATAPDIGADEFAGGLGSAIPPTVITNPATSITANGAQLNGAINANGYTSIVTFEWGLTTAYGNTIPGNPASVTGSTSTPVLAALSGLTANQTYHFRVCASNAGGSVCGLDESFTTICPLPGSAGTISGPTSVCQNSTGQVYSVGTIPDATSYLWIIPAGATIFSGSGTNTITVNYSPSATSGNISVNGTSICGNGSTSTLGITVNPMPVPTISGSATACAGTIVTYTTQTGMTGYTWAISPGGTIQGATNMDHVNVIWSTTGSNTVTVNYINGNGCTAVTPGSFILTVNDMPASATSISGTFTLCAGTSGVAYTTPTIPGAVTYAWTFPAGATIIAGNGTNSITVDFASNAVSGSISVYANNSCGNGAPYSVPLTVNPLPAPTIAGSATACQGSVSVYTTQLGMTNYNWTVSPGGTIQGSTNTSQITILWSTSGGQSMTVNYTNGNGCTAVVPGTFSVTVYSLPTPTITGSTTLCVNSGYYYYITEAGFSNYQWTVSPGGVITSGGGTNQVQVSWTGAGSQWVAVNYSNPAGCTASAPTQLPINVSDVPSPASDISGSPELCAGTFGVAYSTSLIPDAVTYVWTLPAGATIATGNGTNNITVDFSTNAVSGNITVCGNNLCGNGTYSSPYAVTVNAIPATPTVTVSGDTLVSNASTGNQWFFKEFIGDIGAPISGANAQTYIALQNGFYWTIVTLAGCSSDTSNNQHVIWMATPKLSKSPALSIYPVPNEGCFTYSFTAITNREYSITVYNYLGSIIWQRKEHYLTGTATGNIDLKPVAAGVYSVMISDGLNKAVRGVVVR